jgi:hypothetical protein
MNEYERRQRLVDHMIDLLIDETLEITEVLASDLETGNYYENNAAHERFKQTHPRLYSHLCELMRKAALIKEQS